LEVLLGIGLLESKLRIFISSVQKEMEPERDSARLVINYNAALDEYFQPVRYEDQPASSAVAIRQCVELVGTCQVYVLIVGEKAGSMHGQHSITHAEFRKARELFEADKMELLVFRKKVVGSREKGAEALLADVYETGVKYKEYSTFEEFREEFIFAIRALLKGRITPVEASRIARAVKETTELASDFEMQDSTVPLTDFDSSIARRMIAAWDNLDADRISDDELNNHLMVRGHVVRRQKRRLHATRLGALVLAKDPTKDLSLVNASVMAEAYSGATITARTRDQQLISGPAEYMVAQGLEFVSRNTRHPDRVVGMRRITLDEYPKAAVREALVNAIAHRNYEDVGSRTRLQVFSDRIVVSSPGLTTSPLTPQRLKSGEARPRSRNPLLAQSLYRLDLMENRGSGIQRIREIVAGGGLKDFDIKAVDGHLEMTLFGPGENIDALPLPREVLDAVLPVSRRRFLNERQLMMAEHLGRGEILTSRA
jgi:ATP-dependent DNA helicase RecG